MKDVSRHVLYSPLVLYVKPGPDDAIAAILDDDLAKDPFTARIELAMQRWMWKKVATTSETDPASQNERGCEFLECAERDTEPHDAVIWFGDERANEIRAKEAERDHEPFIAVTLGAAVGAGGLGAGALFTNVLPGMVLFAPYVIAVMLIPVWVLGLGLGCTAGQLRNPAPPGTWLHSTAEAIAKTMLILMITAMFVTAATVSTQFYAGVRWDQAIVNDWEVRTFASIRPCASLAHHQLIGALLHCSESAGPVLCQVRGLCGPAAQPRRQQRTGQGGRHHRFDRSCALRHSADCYWLRLR